MGLAQRLSHPSRRAFIKLLAAVAALPLVPARPVGARPANPSVRAPTA